MHLPTRFAHNPIFVSGNSPAINVFQLGIVHDGGGGTLSAGFWSMDLRVYPLVLSIVCKMLIFTKHL